MATYNPEFIPFDEAKALNKLLFDKPTMAGYTIKTKAFKYATISTKHFTSATKTTYLAPMYQQAFRWFRENYGLAFEILSIKPSSTTPNNINLHKGDGSYYGSNVFYDDYNAAQLDCLRKLIIMANS